LLFIGHISELNRQGCIAQVRQNRMEEAEAKGGLT
jgi:hypothetical protein